MVRKMGKRDDFTILDPQKVYCSQCFAQGKVTEIVKSKTLKDRFEAPKCGHFGIFSNRLQYFDGKWFSIRGLSTLSVPKQIPWKCNNCGFKGKFTQPDPKCPKCGNEEETRSPSWTCHKCGWSTHSLFSFHHKCSNCGHEQDDNVPDSTWRCPKCGKIKEVRRVCPECGHTESNSIGFTWT